MEESKFKEVSNQKRTSKKIKSGPRKALILFFYFFFSFPVPRLINSSARFFAF